MESLTQHGTDITNIEHSSNPSSLDESEEDYLRATWQKLGVGQDGYLDQFQLALVCECIGMEKVSDEVITQLFEKLDLDRDGRISFGEFLHLFRTGRKGEMPLDTLSYNQTEWKTTGISGTIPLCPQLLTPSQSTVTAFLSIDPGGTGFATYNATVEWLHSLGIPQVPALLDALNLGNSSKINLRDLLTALQEEMNSGLESGILSHNGHVGLAVHAAILLMQHELTATRSVVEHTSRECDKLRSDLQEANQRSSLLAQEVDENHAKQETVRRLQLRQLEQRHADQLRLVQEVAQAERDQLISQLQRELDLRQQQLFQAKEEENRLKESIVLAKEDNARLSAENAQLSEQLTNSERANGRLLRELDGVSLVRNTMVELESRCEALEESQRHSLTEQLNRLSAENLQLRDRNDELSAEIESLRGKLAFARSENGRLGMNSAWRSEPTVSGAIKRRNESDERPITWVEDMGHIGKIRKKDLPENVSCSPEESPRQLTNIENPKEGGHHNQKEVVIQEQQSLAAQLQEAKQQSSGTTIKEQLKRVFEKLRLQIVEEFLEGNDSVVALQRQYHNVLRQQEDRHLEEKRGIVESYLLKLSAVEVQLDETQIRCDDLVQLQKVMEAEHEMELNDLKNQLNQLKSKENKEDDYENLTQALADLDAALEIELQGESNNYNEKGKKAEAAEKSKVLELEQQCRTLESELDCVKVEIVKIVLENEELRQKVKQYEDNTDKTKREAEEAIEERIAFETALLQQRIRQLMRESEEEKQKQQAERNAFNEEKRDLEARLELLRSEFERLDDYWQIKIEEERDLYDQERDLTDEKFRALELKIKEYEELLSHSDASSTSSLSTIEERANWEKQLNDLEEECQSLKEQITEYKANEERINQQYQMEIEAAKLEEEKLRSELTAMMTTLGEMKEKYEQTQAKLEQLQSCKSPRPLSPTPKPAILPSGYSPLKSKGWARTPLSLPGSPKGCIGIPVESVDIRRLLQASGTASLNDGHPDSQQRSCRVDFSVFHALNARLKQQEQRCRELQIALRHQKQRTEQIMLETKIQHEEEIKSLESMMKTSQDTLHQMMVKHQQTMDKLTASDLLIMELYTENSHLLRALHLQSLQT